MGDTCSECRRRELREDLATAIAGSGPEDLSGGVTPHGVRRPRGGWWVAMKLMPLQIRRLPGLPKAPGFGSTAAPQLPESYLHEEMAAFFPVLGFLAGLGFLVLLVFFTALYIGGFG
jgi:hypothetical protein